MDVVVLSGGGSKGAWQLGVLKKLYASEEFDSRGVSAFFGVSTGALTSAVLAQGRLETEQLDKLLQVEKIYLDIKNNDSIYKGSKSSIITKALNLLLQGGLFDPSPLKKLVEENVDPEALKGSGVHLSVGSVDLETGEYVQTKGHSDRIREAVLASASQPILFQVPTAEVDGGVRNVTPVADACRWLKDSGRGAAAIRRGEPIHLWVIVASPIGELPFKRISPKDAKAVLLRTFEIIMREASITDLKNIRKKNKNPDPDDLPLIVHLFAPEVSLGDGLTFDPENIRDMIRAGGMAEEIHHSEYLID